MQEATITAGTSVNGPLPTTPPLDDPKLYINRELSWLEFNRRVLDEGLDPAVPLMERIKFLDSLALSRRSLSVPLRPRPCCADHCGLCRADAVRYAAISRWWQA